jgi:4-amino-4-deoxy-L-arabinose transferase-like glycosyltransferase
MVDVNRNGIARTPALKAHGRVERAWHNVPTWVGAMVVAVALGLFRLGYESFWFDEAFSAHSASLDWGTLWHVVSTNQANMSLYYVLLHLWLLLGESEVAIRGFSLLTAVLTVPVVYALARRLFGQRFAGLASILLATNAFFIFYAQEARSYTLVLLLVSYSSLLFVKALDKSSWSLWLGYAMVTGLAMYAHFFAAFVPAAHLCTFAIRRRLPERRALAAYVLLALLSTPLIAFVLTRDQGQLAWIERPGIGALPYAFRELAGGTLPLLLAYFVACCAALVHAFRHTNSSDRWRVGFLVVWALLPVVASWILSQFKPIFQAYYLIVALPALVLLVASGLLALPRWWQRSACALVVVVLSLHALIAGYERRDKEDWRDVAGYVRAYSRPDDGILFYVPLARPPFEYYVNLQHVTRQMPVPLFPAAPWGGNPILASYPEDVAPMLQAIRSRRPARVWLVLSHVKAAKDPAALGQLDASLQRLYPHVSEQSFVGVQVKLFTH